MLIKRRNSKLIKIGNCLIGGKHPIAIQSMTKTRTADFESTIKQIRQLEDVGCQIVRLAIKDLDDAKAIKQIKKSVKLPLVADIHFSYRLALAAIENGADKIRLNPGNISSDRQISDIVAALKMHQIPLRIGLNSGSVKNLSNRKTSMTDRLVASGLSYIRKIERLKFNNLVISLKANNVLDTVQAYRKIAKICNYPLHLGLTATGLPDDGIIKSSIALGALLLEGIGDTIRVSLTAHPVTEVKAAKGILESLNLIKSGTTVISCPTCGRCEVDLISIVKELEEKISLGKPSKTALKIAVMGCVVNGPGEAKEADLGIAFGKTDGLLFKKGKASRKVSSQDAVKVLLREMEKIK